MVILLDCMKLLDDGGGLVWGFIDVLMFWGLLGMVYGIVWVE